MVNFKHLEKLHVSQEDTEIYIFTGIMGRPRLRVKHAGECNHDFLNAALKENKKFKRQNRGRTDQEITEASIVSARKQDIVLFAKTVLVDWFDVVDSQGNKVDFSVDNAIQFLEAIPSDMFTDLKEFCLDIENFREIPDEMDSEELEAIQGNSKSG